MSEPTLSTAELDPSGRLDVVTEALLDKQGERPVVMDMREVLGVIDTFVVVHGRNARHVRTLVDEVHDQVRDRCGGEQPVRTEGLADATWVLMDYGDLVVHVFDEATRSFYDLEHLWRQAPSLEVADDLAGEATGA